MGFESEEIQLSIILQEVINNRTSEEWQEIFRQSIEEDSAIIAEVMNENDRLRNQNKALAVVAGGLALFITGMIAKRVHENKAEPNRKGKF
jgi:hypothetical protein